MNNRISKRTLHRLPSYLSLLEEKEKEGVEYISATTIANILGLNHVQVRKDLSCASNAGKPKQLQVPLQQTVQHQWKR